MQVLLKLNELRQEAGAPALECSNRAVGTAVAFAETMCQQYVAPSDVHLGTLR